PLDEAVVLLHHLVALRVRQRIPARFVDAAEQHVLHEVRPLPSQDSRTSAAGIDNQPLTYPIASPTWPPRTRPPLGPRRLSAGPGAEAVAPADHGTGAGDEHLLELELRPGGGGQPLPKGQAGGLAFLAPSVRRRGGVLDPAVIRDERLERLRVVEAEGVVEAA